MEDAESAKLFLEIVTIALRGGALHRRHAVRGGQRNAAVILPAAGNVTPPSSCPRLRASRLRHPARGWERHATVILPTAGNVTLLQI